MATSGNPREMAGLGTPWGHQRPGAIKNPREMSSLGSSWGHQESQGDDRVGDPMGTLGTPGRWQGWGRHGDIGNPREMSGLETP